MPNYVILKYMSKTCVKCGSLKEFELFPRDKKVRDGYNSWCYECRREYKKTPQYLAKSRVAKKAHREANYADYRYYEFKKELRKFNLDIEAYNKLVESQNNSCAICNVPQSELKRRLCIDHDHITGKVRQLLCNLCNVGLGHFKDSEQLLKLAHEYLIRHRS